MFWRIAQLCKKGFIPPIIQSSVSFQSAAKYTATETIRIVWDSFFGVVKIFKPAFGIALFAFLILVVEYVLNIQLISYFIELFSKQFFEVFFAYIKIVILTLARPEVSAALWIIFLSKLFSSSWFSLFRLFGTEHLRIDLPKRVANCCCLQFRCVACSAFAFISLLPCFTWCMMYLCVHEHLSFVAGPFTPRSPCGIHMQLHFLRAFLFACTRFLVYPTLRWKMHITS